MSERKLRLFACACFRHIWKWLNPIYSDAAVTLSERWADGDPVRQELEAITGSAGDRVIRVLHPGDAINNATAIVGIAEMHNTAVLPGFATILRQIVGNPWKQLTLTRSVYCDRCNGKGQRTLGVSCGTCNGSGTTKGNADWLTPQVQALAHAAYTHRLEAKCGRCEGRKGHWTIKTCGICNGTGGNGDGYSCYGCAGSGNSDETYHDCPDCHGTGTTGTGQLDPDRLSVLADCLEENGCDDATILASLRGMEVCHGCGGTRSQEIDIGGPEDNPDILYVMQPPKAILMPCSGCSGSGWVAASVPRYRGFWCLDLLTGRS